MKKEKRNLVKLLVIILVLSMIFFVGLDITGKAISATDDGFVNVTRAPIINNTLENTKEILLSIYSSENILAIEEVFIGEDCSVLAYNIDQEVDIFNFNSSLNLWILGNRSDTLVFNLSYSIPGNCNVDELEGKVYVLEGDAAIIPTDDTPSGTGGGGTSGAPPANLQTIATTPIIQAKDEADFNTLISAAANRLAGITDESQRLEKGNFYPFLILVGVGIIIISLIIFFILIKKPKDFETKKPKDKAEILAKYLKEFKGKFPLEDLKNKILSAGYSEKDFNDALKKN